MMWRRAVVAKKFTTAVLYYSRSLFLSAYEFGAKKRVIFLWIYAIRNPHSCLHFASFFKFMHAKVSATFMIIRALPYICVYRNPWFSFAVPKIRSMVSFRWEYNSFIPCVCRISSQLSIYSSHTCLVTTFTWFLLSVHCERYSHFSQMCPQLLYSRYPSLFVVL